MEHTIGFIGLGKMGTGIVEHLLEQRIGVVAYNRTPKTAGFPIEKTLKDVLDKLPVPKIIFLMVAATGVDDVISQLTLSSGDIVIDGGNSFYKDTVRRASILKQKGIHFIDSGTSGGLTGARHGACLMLGGDETVVKSLSWLWDALAVKDGWEYLGPSGAGHFVKMVHNGVEYGMDQAIGEGFEILSKGPYTLDLANIASVWDHGSIVRGYLIELAARALKEDPQLLGLTGKIGGGETGAWTADAAKELGVDATVLSGALAARQKSKTTPTFATKVVSALRKGYGGHDEAK